jgi:gamma-glutamyl-gamma-aminobutyrate hydrolase PuuD
MVTRPLIGLTAYEEEARWGVWDEPGVLLPSAYIRAVLAAGGLPVLIPPAPGVAAEILPRLDGLILAGGPDLDPGRYGQAPLETTGPPRTRRDDSELGLIAAAGRAVPVLGICRGLQLINVARGGTLIQHLPDRLDGSKEHAPAPAVYGRHPVEVVKESRLAQALGQTATDVLSYHHQAIDELGTGLTVTALAPDGTIEGIEDPSRPFFLAVQWHPEVDDDPSLFRALVEAAAEQAGVVH